MAINAIPPDARFGFGVVAGLPAELLTTLATEVARLGYTSFWVNDSGRPDADGLAGLAVVAAVAPGLELGVGVLPLDKRSPAEIAAHVQRLALPLDRLRLGVGSGGSKQPLGLVRDGVTALRGLLPEARIFVSALGPQMSHLAGEIADGVLFNWAVPDRLAEVNRLVDEGEAAANRSHVERWSYVRGTVGRDARKRLAAEAERYAGMPGYGRAFTAMGVPFVTVGVAGADLRSQLEPYRDALDGVVVRALPPEWTSDEALAIARAAAPPATPGTHG